MLRVKNSLAATQQRFITALFNPNELQDNGEINDQRLQIYRHNIYAKLTKALRLLYPAIDRLVGEEFFNGTAYRYIETHPTDEFGHDFADFLVEFPPAKILPYLPEVAQLEFAYHQVSHAADCKPFDIEKLTAIEEQHYDTLRFQLHPASRLLAFRYPIFRIWQMCQNAAETNTETVNLDDGGDQLLIRRRELTMELVLLSKGEYAFLAALAGETSFADACTQALAAEPDFDITEAFKQHILRGTIVNFFTHGELSK